MSAAGKRPKAGGVTDEPTPAAAAAAAPRSGRLTDTPAADRGAPDRNLVKSMQQALSVRQALAMHAAKQSALIDDEALAAELAYGDDGSPGSMRKRRKRRSARAGKAERDTAAQGGKAAKLKDSSKSSESGSGSSHGRRKPPPGTGAAAADVPGPSPVLRELVSQYNALSQDVSEEAKKIELLRAWVVTTLKPGLAQMRSRLAARADELVAEFGVAARPFGERGTRLAPHVATLGATFDELSIKLSSEVSAAELLLASVRADEDALRASVEALAAAVQRDQAHWASYQARIEAARLEGMEERLSTGLAGTADEAVRAMTSRVEQSIAAAFAAATEQIEQHAVREAVRAVDLFTAQLKSAHEEQAKQPHPQNPHNHNAATRQAELLAWLTQHGLESYFRALKEYGFDTLAVMPTLSAAEIESMVAKPGHRRALAMAVEQLRAQQLLNE